MRSRYQIHETHRSHFITSTFVEWLPVLTTAIRYQIIADSLLYCQEQKGLKIYAWVLLDNHLHAIVSAPDLTQVLADFKRHAARRLIDQLESEGCEWLLNQLRYYRAKHKQESEFQVCQEGVHPQSIADDAMMHQKMEYVHLNPVRRGWVLQPEHWVWSSAHERLPGALPIFRCDLWQ